MATHFRCGIRGWTSFDGRAGELQYEGCAREAFSVGSGAHADGAAVALDNLAGNPEAQAGAYVLLGGEERLEDAVDVLGFDTGSAVGDDDLHQALVAGWNLLAADDDGAVG